MKNLICVKDIENLEKQGQKVCYMDGNTLITPSAKDAARSYGIELSTEAHVCEPKPCDTKTGSFVPVTTNPGEGAIDSELVYQVLKTLMEKGLLNGMFDGNGQKNLPYEEERDANGLKLIRGNSVKEMDVFDTGNPDATVYYKELISKDDAKISAGFLVIDHSHFDWELSYEEIDYVIEGTLTITINGKTYTAHPGDVLFVPSGSKVVWGSPDRAKVFYATYPANWADLI